jgi:hypothetical protein
MSKKTFVALTLLACAVLDDREGSDCMETAVRYYCESRMTPGSGDMTAAAAPGYLSATATCQLAVQIAKVLEDSFRCGESTISLQPAGRSGKKTRSVTRKNLTKKEKSLRVNVKSPMNPNGAVKVLVEQPGAPGSGKPGWR